MQTINSILIIDDELEVCQLLELFLTKKSKKAAHAVTLKEGEKKFRDMKPDLLLLDHNLPDGYGIQNIPAFKKEFPDSKIVIMSAMSDLKTQALEKGADYFIEKPISFSALNAILMHH